MSRSYEEVLETFPGNSQGKEDAWEASQKYAGMVVSKKAQGAFGVGVRQMMNEVGQRIYAVVLVKRTDIDQGVSG